MKSTGITRPVDALGRVVIPMEIRESFDINPKDLLDIYVEGDKIILTKYNPSCSFCGSDDEIIEFKGKKICIHCFNELKTIC